MTNRWFKYHKGAKAKQVTLTELSLSKTDFSDNAVLGSTLATIVGTHPQAIVTTTDPRFEISNDGKRLIRASGSWVDGPSTLVLTQILNRAAVNSPHDSVINFTVSPPVGGVVLTPGITPYRSWAIEDESALAQQGNPTDYGYSEKAVGIWINGMYDTFTDTFNFGVTAWKSSSLANFKLGDLRGIAKVEFSANNGPKTTITTPTTDAGTGIEGFWAQLRASDFDHSQTIEIRAYIWPKIGKPMILQGRAGAGPPGQTPTYDADAGPIVPLWNGTAYVNTACAIDPRVWTSGPVNGGTMSYNAHMHTGWSLVCNVDTGDGLMPSLDMFIDPANGNDSNDGLTQATAFKTFDAIVAKAPAAMASRFGTIHDGNGNAWADIGGLRINLLGNLNHSTGCTTDTSMLGAANQWVTIKVADGVARSAVKITSQAGHPFFAEKIRLLGLDFYQTGFYKDDNGTAWLKRYGDLRIEDCTFDMGPNPIMTNWPMDARSFTPYVKVTNGGTGYSDTPTITSANGTGMTFTATVTGGVITSVSAGPLDQYNNFLGHPVGYMHDETLVISDPSGSGAVLTLKMGGDDGTSISWRVVVHDPGSNYTNPTVTAPSGTGITFTPTLLPDKTIAFISVGWTTAPTGYNEGDWLTITDSTGSGAKALLVKGVGYNAKIIDTGSGYTTPPTVTLQGGNPPGTDFAATIANGKVTSILCWTSSSTTAVTQGTPFVFSGGGGSGAAASIYCLYGGSPGGGPDGTGNTYPLTMNVACRGHLELLDPPGKATPTFQNIPGTSLAQTVTLARNIWLNKHASAADVIGGAKGLLKVRLTNSKEYQIPGINSGAGNHYDFLQPYNSLWNIVYEDVDNSDNCNLQGFFCDGNAPIHNGALIRPKLVSTGGPLPAQQIAFGGGATNLVVVDPITSWVNGGYNNIPFTDVRVQLTDAAVGSGSNWANGAGWGGAAYQSPEYVARKGMSIIYSSTPDEPYDHANLSTVFDSIITPSKILEVLDAKIGGSLQVVKAGSDTRTDPRVYYWRDPRTIPSGERIITAMTNANPAVFTCNNHGFTTNQYVQIGADPYSSMRSTATGSPAMSSNGSWFIQVVDANTFTLMDSSGVAYDGTSAGTYDPTSNGTILENNIQYTMVDGGPTSYVRDQRRPKYLVTGLNSQPCVALNQLPLVGMNDTTNYPYPNCVDQGLDGGVGPYGAMTHELWYCGSLDHSVTDTTDRYLFSWGNNAASFSVYRSVVSGNQLLRVAVPCNNGTTYSAAIASTDAAFGSITGSFFMRIQALSTGVTLTVWNAANPNGMTWTTNFSAGYSKKVIPGRTGIGGRHTGLGSGDPGYFTSQRISARVMCLALNATEVSAMVTEFKSRLGF